MQGRSVCPLAILVIASVLYPGLVTPQCTTKYCRDGQGETDLWTSMLHLQESFDGLQKHVTKQNEIIRSLQQHMTEQDELIRSMEEVMKGKYGDILIHHGTPLIDLNTPYSRLTDSRMAA